MTVINKYWYYGKVPEGAVSIMRDSPFGNPFHLGRDGDRATVIKKYRRYLWDRLQTDPEFRAKVKALKGLRLCCVCAPKPCHGDVLERAVIWLNSQDDAA